MSWLKKLFSTSSRHPTPVHRPLPVRLALIRAQLAEVMRREGVHLPWRVRLALMFLNCRWFKHHRP
jgi:hypothetical protein